MARFLRDQLKSSRHSQFVGRNAELALFESAVGGNEYPFFVMHIFGPGGVGKTTLLNEFMYMCDREEINAVYIDARDLQPIPDLFTKALQDALAVPPTQSLNQFLEALPEQLVLMIDTYEALTPLDNWLRTVFLPSLPDQVLTIIAGRNPPGYEWQSDFGWQGILRTISLRNLSPKESRALLGKRGVPVEQQSSVLGFTHGHPLALSLIADLFYQQGRLDFRAEEAPDIVEMLLQRFADDMSNPLARSALEVCALVRMTTEGILQALLDFSDEPSNRVHELFDWLHGLSFIESGRGGLFPHDLAREVLSADLRWRSPERWAELAARARKYYSARLQQVSDQDQQNILIDYVYLHRNNPVVRPFYNQVETSQMAGTGVITDRYRETDREAILALIRKFEGDTSAYWAEFWLDRQPDQVLIIREGNGSLGGLLFPLALQEASEADLQQDPATRAITNYINSSRPIREGEAATLFRFWMSQDSYQSISPLQILVGINMLRHYLTTPRLALTFNPCAEPDFWFPILSYADLSRIPEADYEIDDRRYGVFFHDWRTTPASAWLDLLAERESLLTPELPTPKKEEPLIVLSHTDFEEAVRKALKTLNQPAELQTNLLLKSRLVIHKFEELNQNGERALVLADLLRGAVDSLNENVKDGKFFRVLYHTFIQPAPTQEQVAEMLNLPFPTYRYQLKIGVARVIEKLWQIELGLI